MIIERLERDIARRRVGFYCENFRGDWDNKTSRVGDWKKNIIQVLSSYGYHVEKLFDKGGPKLLVDNSIKVKIKVAHLKKYKGKSQRFAFDFQRDDKDCDFYILVTVYNNYFHPAFVVPVGVIEKTHLNLYPHSTKFLEYQSRFDFLHSLKRFRECGYCVS